MARIRSVHPGLFTDERWVSCSPLARILVIGLWTDADDQGVFEWKPLQIKMRLLPGDMADAGELLAEIERAGLIMAYDAGGKAYGAIRNFRKFQRPQKPNAIHPLPDCAALFVGISKSDPTPVREESATSPVIVQQMEDGGGEEEKVSDADASSVELRPTEPWLKDEDFTKAWNACTAEMRKRSSKAKAWPEWRKAKRSAPSPDLAASVARYAALDPDVQRTGGPGFHIWIKNRKWEHWLRPEEPAAPAVAWGGPADLRTAIVAAKGEPWAASWLDRCRWRDLPDKAVVSDNSFVVDTLRKDPEASAVFSAHGVRVQLERAA